MAGIKYVALDIYGTILPSDDSDYELAPRKGSETFLNRCRAAGIKIISASDSDIKDVKIDLAEYGIRSDLFDDFMQFTETPKDFSRILEKYVILPSELMVIGDSHEKDINGAKAIGALYVEVPKYVYGSEFDIGSIAII